MAAVPVSVISHANCSSFACANVHLDQVYLSQKLIGLCTYSCVCDLAPYADDCVGLTTPCSLRIGHIFLIFLSIPVSFMKDCPVPAVYSILLLLSIAVEEAH
eukprot:6197202-Pleurochrysis_carterae.AAC.3